MKNEKIKHYHRASSKLMRMGTWSLFIIVFLRLAVPACTVSSNYKVLLYIEIQI